MHLSLADSQVRVQQEEEAQQQSAAVAATAAAQRMVTPGDVYRVQQRSHDSIARRNSLVAGKEERMQRRSLVQAQLLAQVGIDQRRHNFMYRYSISRPDV